MAELEEELIIPDKDVVMVRIFHLLFLGRG